MGWWADQSSIRSRPSAHPCPRRSPLFHLVLTSAPSFQRANSRRRPSSSSSGLRTTPPRRQRASERFGPDPGPDRPESTWTAASTKRRSPPLSAGSASSPSAPPQTRRRRAILPRRPRGASSPTLISRGTRPHLCARPRPSGSTTTPTPPPPSLPPTPAAPQIPHGPTSARAHPPATPRLRRLTGTMAATITLHTSSIYHHKFTLHPRCHKMHQGAVHGEVLCSSRILCQDTKELLALHLLGAHILVLKVEVLIQIHQTLGSGTRIPAEVVAQ